MNLKKLAIATFAAITLSINASAATKIAFILINDDSGVMTNMEQIPNLRMQLLGQYKALKKHGRRYARAEMVVISTSLARPVWYGKISDLGGHRGGEVLERTANNPKSCNQLAASFDAARNVAVQLSAQGYNEIHISVFSSLISTPVPCSTAKITLPQLPVPVDWAASLAPTSHVRSVIFYAVNAHQYSVYTQALAPLTKWAGKNSKTFAVHDVEASINILRFGLKGVK